MEHIILVDEKDNETGFMEKMEAHREALLHRAFSIFVFDSQQRLLLHKRNPEKYHSGGLWTNTCCGHPRPGEKTEDAATRRLFEEMGFSCQLEKEFDFIYKAQLDNGLTEYEFDHVFYGSYSEDPNVNPDEVSAWKYISLNDLLRDLLLYPENYTVWFKICIGKIIESGKIPVAVG